MRGLWVVAVAVLFDCLAAWAAPPRPPAEPASKSLQAGKSAGGARQRPNLLVFLADDLGAADLGCTGSTFYRTPAIDRLAAEGMLFSRGYAAGPVCSPTRAGLVTGRHPARVRITNFIGGDRRGPLLPAEYLRALPDAEVTIAEQLMTAGYATGVFGKWHLGPPADIRLHGYEENALTNVAPGRGPAEDPMHARAIAAKAAAFIAMTRDRPWLCYVPMHSVHVPLAARRDLIDEETARAAALPARSPREIDEGGRKARAVQDLPVYAAMVREMDDTVATILAAVEQAGVRGDTLVIFTSDNGGLSTAESSPTSNLPLRAGKGYLYEGGIRVPLIVRWPGVVKPGTTTDAPATTMDVAATLLDAAGAPVPPGLILDGESLRPLLADTAAPPPRDLFWHYPHYANQGGRPAGAILAGDGPRPGSEKLVEHFEDDRVELFDLSRDPGERRDLSAERPERVMVLRDRLAAWRKGLAAAMPTPNPVPVDPYGPDAIPR
jgi:arylsulfatase A-like enzyme